MRSSDRRDRLRALRLPEGSRTDLATHAGTELRQPDTTSSAQHREAPAPADAEASATRPVESRTPGLHFPRTRLPLRPRSTAHVPAIETAASASRARLRRARENPTPFFSPDPRATAPD